MAAGGHSKESEMSKLPIPVEIVDIRFLISATAPDYAVLELDTSTNPVRVFLRQSQLDQLATQARITSVKLSSGRTAG
jgi:hypothetical protein